MESVTVKIEIQWILFTTTLHEHHLDVVTSESKVAFVVRLITVVAVYGHVLGGTTIDTTQIGKDGNGVGGHVFALHCPLYHIVCDALFFSHFVGFEKIKLELDRMGGQRTGD